MTVLSFIHLSKALFPQMPPSSLTQRTLRWHKNFKRNESLYCNEICTWKFIAVLFRRTRSLEKTQILMNWWIKEKSNRFTQWNIAHNYEEQRADMCYHTDQHQKPHAQWKRQTKSLHSVWFLFIWNTQRPQLQTQTVNDPEDPGASKIRVRTVKKEASFSSADGVFS